MIARTQEISGNTVLSCEGCSGERRSAEVPAQAGAIGSRRARAAIRELLQAHPAMPVMVTAATCVAQGVLVYPPGPG